MPEEEIVETQPSEPADDSDVSSLGVEELRRELDSARADVARLHSENAGRRHRERELEERFEQLQREHETEQQRHDREIEERVRAQLSADHERELAAIRRERLADRVKIRAAGKFADPDDAPFYVDLDALATAENPDEAIDKQLADVLERKGHLAARNGGRQPLVSQGPRSERPARPNERQWLRG